MANALTSQIPHLSACAQMATRGSCARHWSTSVSSNHVKTTQLVPAIQETTAVGANPVSVARHARSKWIFVPASLARMKESALMGSMDSLVPARRLIMAWHVSWKQTCASTQHASIVFLALILAPMSSATANQAMVEGYAIEVRIKSIVLLSKLKGQLG